MMTRAPDSKETAGPHIHKDCAHNALNASAVQPVDNNEPNLWRAAQNGQLETIKRLIETKQATVNQTTNDAVTALHWASINNHVDVALYLLQNGASVNQLGGMIYLWNGNISNHLECQISNV